MKTKKLSALRALWIFWLGAALMCIGLLRYQQQQSESQLPLPKSLERLEIIRADTTLRFSANPDWQYEGQAAAKLGQWIEQLRNGCGRSYLEKDIQLPEDTPTITLRFNQYDDWIFSAYNPFNRSHYLHHQGRVYLCDEQLKPRLTLPPQYWLGTHEE